MTGAPPGPLEAVAVDAVDRALRSLAALQRDVGALAPDHPAYLDLRRAAAAGAPFWQRRAAVGAEVLLGPPRSIDEAGGALLLLDAAIESGDREAASREMAQIEQTLRLIHREIAINRIPLEVAAPALSSAAFDLGAIALESSSGLPSGAAAVLADMRGTLDVIEQSARALALTHEKPKAPAEKGGKPTGLEAVLAETAPLRARLDAVRTSLDLSDKASFVVATGRLGAAVRRLTTSVGAQGRLPYAPRIPAGDGSENEPVSALTLPGPRAPRPGADAPSEAVARLGRKLFSDPRLSRGDVRSCASCHKPARGFADGLATPRSLDSAVPRLRHTPSLLYTSLNAAQLWDGRTLTAEEQALGVIHSRAEMGLTSDELVAKLSAIPELRDAFRNAFPITAGSAAEAAPRADALTAKNVGQALAAFEVQALVPADAPIDRFARGDERALSADEKAGLDVFAGAGRCARCHVPPFFGGSRPRDFAIAVFAVLGVPDDPRGRALDPDRGRALVTGRALDERAFKTPTVRNAARTAPYFHNGSFRTLEEVVDFYNRGGGRGLGLAVENQDPDVRPLKLSPEQVRVLLVFMRTALLDKTPPERLLPAGG